MSVVSGTLQATLTNMTPLLLAALGENIVQRAGLVNVGLEGMMLVGAFAGFMIAKPTEISLFGATVVTGNPYAGLVAAGLTGLLMAVLFGIFVIHLRANQVVVGVVINLLALGLTGTLYRRIFGETGSFITSNSLPHILAQQNLLMPLAVLMTPILWWFLHRTRTGLELRACGEQPIAAEAAGVNVMRMRFLAILFGGVMAGIAGAFLSIGDVSTFKEEMTAGRGFIALAIVTSGRWSPWGCLLAAIIFGFAQALQFQFQAVGWRVSSQLFLVLPYVVTLLVLMMGSRWSQAPAALGQPYRRN
jgi:ABC-type uncharacterized transport system permease subunit